MPPGDPGTSGIDTPDDAAKVPDGFPGYVWTNEIDTIAAIFSSQADMSAIDARLRAVV